MTISMAWVGFGENFGQPSTNSILINRVFITVNYIWDYIANVILSGVDPHDHT